MAFLCLNVAVVSPYAQARSEQNPGTSVVVGNNLNVGRDLIIGLTKSEVEDLISAALKNESSEKLIQIAAESKLSTEAVRQIFQSVVGHEAGDISIQEQVALILENWLELRSRLENVKSDDEGVINLRQQALTALNAGNRQEAERILLEAKRQAIGAARAARDLADKRLRDAAESSADLAQLSITSLRFSEAAQRYAEAAEILPSADVKQKCDYLIEAGDAALEAGDYDLARQDLTDGADLAQPEGIRLLALRAEIQHRIGRVYLFQGDSKTAGDQLSSALSLERLEPNQDKTEEADTLEDLAVTQWNVSDFKGAQADLQMAEDLSAGADSPRGMLVHSEALNTEGGLLTDLGEFSEAEKDLLAAFDLRKHLLAGQPFSPRIIDSENNLGFLYRQWARPSDADKYLEKAEAAARMVYGNNHLTLSVILVNRSIVACNLRDFPKALGLINEAQDIRRRKIPGVNLLTAYSLDVEGMVLLYSSRTTEARSDILSSYKMRSTLLPDKDQAVAKSYLAMGELDIQEGHLETARKEVEAALRVILHLFSPTHPLAGLAFRRLSQIAAALHEKEQAAEYAAKAALVRFPTSDCDL